MKENSSNVSFFFGFDPWNLSVWNTHDLVSFSPQKKPFGPVFSRMKILDSDVEDPDGNDEKGDADQKEEGDCNKLQDSEEINLLMGLIQKQDRETVQSLIKENPSLLFQKNSRGMTSLHAACDFGEDLELISWLIDQGSEINAQVNSILLYLPFF